MSPIRLSTTYFWIGTLITIANACSRSASVDPVSKNADKYEITEMKYFINTTDGIDTIAIKLQQIDIPNPSDNLITKQIASNYDELITTSQFAFDQQLPFYPDLDLSQFDVFVPKNWNAGNSYDLAPQKFPMSTAMQKKKYDAYKEQTLTIKIPARSSISVSREIDSYQLQCSFKVVIENVTTGQRYPITGKWRGILNYSNESINLKESKL